MRLIPRAARKQIWGNRARANVAGGTRQSLKAAHERGRLPAHPINASAHGNQSSRHGAGWHSWKRNIESTHLQNGHARWGQTVHTTQPQHAMRTFFSGYRASLNALSYLHIAHAGSRRAAPMSIVQPREKSHPTISLPPESSSSSLRSQHQESVALLCDRVG